MKYLYGIDTRAFDQKRNMHKLDFTIKYEPSKIFYEFPGCCKDSRSC